MELFKNVPSNSIQLILTDIPYGEVSKNGEERAKYEGQLRKIDKGHADVLTFNLSDFLNEVYRVCKGTVYIFCGIEQVSTIFKFFNNKSDLMTRQCGWRKTNPVPSNGQHFWLSSIENCIFAKKRKTIFNQNCKSAIWDFPVGRSKIHPTEKPLELFKYLIESSSMERDIVLDPCAGSGTTSIACINTKRKYILFEKEGDYINLINERLTKKQNQHQKTVGDYENKDTLQNNQVLDVQDANREE